MINPNFNELLLEACEKQEREEQEKRLAARIGRELVDIIKEIVRMEMYDKTE